MDHLVYPGLYHYYEKNPNYGKSKGIEEFEKPTEEYYAAYLGNCMTLGRESLNYEDFCSQVINRDYELFKFSSSCQIRVDRFAAGSFDDIVNFYNKNKETIVRFADTKLNEYFGIIIKNE